MRFMTMREKQILARAVGIQRENWGNHPGGGEVLPHMSYIGMCRCEGYSFQRVYSRIGHRNQRILV